MISKETTDFSTTDFHSGEAILIDKPAGWTSFNVIYKIRKAINIKKTGHAGTLDPLATGLLIICTGKKTKEISKFQDLTKTYTGIITLGKSSPSMDNETEITEEKSVEKITEKDIFSAKEKFEGKIFQVPPMYSAIKYKGKNLYEFARKGKVIEREPREVNVYSFEISDIKIPEIYFKISCSKGTYIRVIANDIGNELGTGGILSSLRRTDIGPYNVNSALSTNEFIKRYSESKAGVRLTV